MTPAGQVWFFDFANDAGVYPIINPNTDKPFSFYEWFSIWLDRSIKELESGVADTWGYAEYIKA